MAILVSPTINFVKTNMKKVSDEHAIKHGDKSCIPDMKDSIMRE